MVMLASSMFDLTGMSANAGAVGDVLFLAIGGWSRRCWSTGWRSSSGASSLASVRRAGGASHRVLEDLVERVGADRLHGQAVEAGGRGELAIVVASVARAGDDGGVPRRRIRPQRPRDLVAVDGRAGRCRAGRPRGAAPSRAGSPADRRARPPPRGPASAGASRSRARCRGCRRPPVTCNARGGRAAVPVADAATVGSRSGRRTLKVLPCPGPGLRGRDGAAVGFHEAPRPA